MRKAIKQFLGYTLTIVILAGSTVAANAAYKDNGKSAFGHSNQYGKVTPADVYGLLQDFESLFTYYIETHHRAISARIRSIELKPVKGKTPEHVFTKLMRLSDSVDKLIAHAQLQPMGRIIREKKKAIPAEVYLQVANNLDALAKLMNKLEPNKTWGDYYAIHRSQQAKNSSDVFAFADLSVRRLDIVLRSGKVN